MKVMNMACAVLALGLAAGCRNTAIILDETAAKLDKPALVTGKYVIGSVRMDTPYAVNEKNLLRRFADEEKQKTPADRLIDWLVEEAPTADSFSRKGDDAATGVPANVVVAGTSQRDSGIGSRLNNFVAFLTLNIWPVYRSEVCTYDVSAVIDGKKKATHFEVEERLLTSWLPLGMVPVPAMADSRGRVRRINEVEREKTRLAVLALFADDAK